MQIDQKDIIRMAREAGIEFQQNTGLTGRVRTTTCGSQAIEKIENLVKAAFSAGADAESKRLQAEGMVTVEHMREQIAAAVGHERDNGQKWFDAVTAQHKQEILAERKGCEHAATVAISLCDDPVAAIRARGQS